MKTFKTGLIVAFMITACMVTMSGCAANSGSVEYTKPEPQTCNQNLDQLQRGMSKDQVKEIFGPPLQSGTTNDGYFFWIVLTDPSTSQSRSARWLEYNSILQLFWDKNNTLIGYRKRCNGTWGNVVGLN